MRSSACVVLGCCTCGPGCCCGVGRPGAPGRDCGRWISGKFVSSPVGPLPLRMTRGSTPKSSASPSRIRNPISPMPPPLPPPPPLGKRTPPPGSGTPKPPLSSRRSSTFSLCLSPRQRIFHHLDSSRRLLEAPASLAHCAWAGRPHKACAWLSGTLVAGSGNRVPKEHHPGLAMGACNGGACGSEQHPRNVRAQPQMLVVNGEIDKETSKNCHTFQAC